MNPRIIIAFGALAVSALAAENAATQAPVAAAAPVAPVAPAALPSAMPRPSARIFDRVELADGRVLSGVRVVSADALRVTAAHAEGLGQIDRRLLTGELARLYPFDEAAAVAHVEASAAARRAAAEETQRRLARDAEMARRALAEEPVRRSSPEPSVAGLEDIAAAVESRAIEFYQNEKRTGSGATLVFGVRTRLGDPVAVSGWANRWRVEGVASYSVYDSVGWGSFTSRSGKKFEAVVEFVPGKRPRVVDFAER